MGQCDSYQGAITKVNTNQGGNYQGECYKPGEQTKVANTMVNAHQSDH